MRRGQGRSTSTSVPAHLQYNAIHAICSVVRLFVGEGRISMWLRGECRIWSFPTSDQIFRTETGIVWTEMGLDRSGQGPNWVYDFKGSSQRGTGHILTV